ncbi:hypothetical protein CANARDRAFT_26444 [[Candida] arabinofermentans NRRL YB-2248]|uniref:Ketoreductase (KR) domain-containing protein n=1 Tax=[Candida] arabinofermentans NRRL YB-2248 TaxID=983967 RepID=A0A1E4T978_9ASCO|nr:hypothetical protein CANARDRAFT_26444 [[Candida] arabinofermentans NRRL YB-2248]
MSQGDPDNLPYFNPSEERRVCFITGGNSGIGYYTVLHLYLHGYIVYLGGRSRTRVETAIKSIKEEAISRRSKFSSKQLNGRFLGDLKFLEIDLLNLQSVNKAAIEFKSREKQLHVIINNAGVMAQPYSKTMDNFEIQLQVNYVSHFLLTNKLLPLLEANDTITPRVVYLSSIGHWLCPIPVELGTQFDYRPNIIFTWFRYGLAKTAGIQFMKSLARSHPTILCFAVHPGFVMNTNLFSHFTRLPLIGFMFWVFFQIFGYIFGVSNEQGSYSTLKCVLSEELTLENDNGKYFATLGVESEPSYVARSISHGDQNWAWTVAELNKRGYSLN